MGRTASDVAAPLLPVLALLFSCASVRGGSEATLREPETQEPVGEALARAVGSDGLGEFDLTDAALIASGFESRALLRGARARFEELAGPLVEQLSGVRDARERAKGLLASLHKKGGLFGEYDARATTLRDVLERRRYNCVSASVVYNILAERLHLRAFAQLLPTHARTVLVPLGQEKRSLIVETTSPEGFDPDSRLQAAILAQVGGSLSEEGRALVSDAGSIVSTVVLIGTIYVNRASIVQEAGDFESAERLFARGEAFAGSSEMKSVLRDQRAALLSQLAADDLLSEEPERLRRAYRTLKVAVSLDPRQPEIRASVYQNLRAAAERMIHDVAQQGNEATLLAVAGEAASTGMDPAERSGLRAFALSEVARLRIDAGRFDEALDAIDLALREQLSSRDTRLKDALEQNRISALRLAAFSAAKKGEYARSLQLLERIRGLPGLSPDQRGDASDDHLRVIHLVGNKRIDENDLNGAAEVYRDGVRTFPGDTTSRHNLVAVLERLALPLVSRASCDQAEDYLEEIRLLDPSSKFPSDARVKCLIERAEARLNAADYAEAVSLLRAARDSKPQEVAVVDNLAFALLRWMAALSSDGRCQEAALLGKELRALKAAGLDAGELRRTLAKCRD